MSAPVFLIRGRCPKCSQPSELAPSNPARPFCSERCKLLDFEGWANGRFVIPVEGEEPDEGRDV